MEIDCPTVEMPLGRPGPAEPPEQVDYLIVTADQLVDAAETHAEYRGENGHRSEVLRISDVLDDGQGGIIDNRSKALAALRGAIRERRRALDEGRTLFVLLLGDSDEEWTGDPSLLPVAQLTGWQWSEASEVTSDNLIADLDGDDLPDVALGRVPARTDAAAEAILSRTRELEEVYHPGPWNYQLHVFASEAGFGDSIDELIEEVGFATVREVPPEWQLSLTYARPGSPYAYPPAGFSDRIYELLNSGSLLTSYIGHGSENEFADVNWDGEWGPILDTGDLDQIDMSNRAPLMVLIACLTGSFDTGDSLSELFLAQPRGPVAIVASTEVSHPYPNGIMTRELAYTMLTQRQPTVGEVYLEAKRRMITAGDDRIRLELDGYAAVDPELTTLEAREDILLAHEHMYVLLGDPAHRIAYPAGTVEITPDADVQAGEPLRICFQVHGPPSGQAVATLEIDRDQLTDDLETWEMDAPDRDQVVERNYAMANDKVIERWEGSYQDGGFGVSFPTSNEHTGILYLRVYVSEGELDAIGARSVVVRRVE
jgi:hypothetical protein